MPALREMYADAGLAGARTYVQSGNVVVRARHAPAELAQLTERLIADRFGLTVPAVVRTRDELAEVLARDPFGATGVPEKLYQVSFLSEQAPAELVDALAALATPRERFAAIDREWYAAYPDGIGRSKLASKMAAKNLGVTATARNWTTVKALLAMADEL
jgi:uncharacterized protein (DUF1697 family)